MKIVIGYDGSDCADVAVADLARAGLPRGGAAVVVSVPQVFSNIPLECYEVTSPEALAKMKLADRHARQLAASLLTEARDVAVQGGAKVAAALPGWTVGVEACGGSAAEAIIRKAEQSRADLIVVGSQGRSAMGRALLGSVSQNVLHYAGCSVRVARAAPKPAVPGRLKLIVAIDGSKDAALAVSAVAGRAWPAGTEARVITVLDRTISTVLPAIDASIGQWVLPEDPDTGAWAKRAVDASVRELTEAGLEAAPLVLDGDPKRALLDEAEQWEADCIFLGARGLGRVERFLLGSVSGSVAARARCTVEVVRFSAS